MNRSLLKYLVPGLIVLHALMINAEDAPDSFLRNGSFEDPAAPMRASDKADSRYKELVNRGVVFPMDSDPMPNFWLMNPGEGWSDNNCVLEYVTGTAGEEVNSGSRAIKITSPAHESALYFNKPIQVVKEDAATTGAITVGQTYKYSFHAKGKGEVRVGVYLWDSIKTAKNLYDYTRLRTIKPIRHDVMKSQGWTQCTGTLVINSPEVGAVIFTIAVRGDVTIDDVELVP